MNETSEPTKNEPNTEIPTKQAIFESLFPGNQYSKLSLFQLQTLLLLGRIYTQPDGNRRFRLQFTKTTTGTDFAEREGMTNPDKISLAYLLRGLTPIDPPTHPTMYLGRSFADLVNVGVGEKLGGAASRRVSVYGFTTTLPTVLMGGDPYETEIVIGILDKENKPCGIIHFFEGDRPRTVKKQSPNFSGKTTLTSVGN